MKTPWILALALCVVSLTLGTACSRKDTVVGPGGTKLTLIAPANQSMKQGDGNKVTIAIMRENFDSPVEIAIDDLPAGVTVVGGSRHEIPAGKLKLDTVTLVSAADAAVVKDHRVSVTAKGPNGIAVTEFFKLTVETR